MQLALRRPQSLLPAIALLAGAALVVITIIMAVVLSAVARGEVLSDWYSFYAAGTMAREGAAADMYDPDAQAQTQRRLFGEDVQPMGYPLPAFASFAFAPLSIFSFKESYFAWLGLNMLLLSGLVALGWRWLEAVPAPTRAGFLVCAAAFAAPVTILAGQVDLFVLTGFAACYALLRAGRRYAAGATLALALVKPHLLIAAVLLLLLKRQWRPIGGLAAAGGPLLVIPALLVSPQLFADQIGLMLSYTSTATAHRVNAAAMINIRGPIAGLTGSSEAWLWLPLLALIAAAAFSAAARVWLARPALHPQSWALALTLPLLYSPHVHAQTLVLLMGAAALYLAADRAGASPQVDLPHVLAAFVAITMLWLLGIAGVALLAFAVMASFGWFVARWPSIEAEPLRLPAERELALAS